MAAAASHRPDSVSRFFHKSPTYAPTVSTPSILMAKALQANHLSAVGSSYCAGPSTEFLATVRHSDATLPWSGSVTTRGEPILATNALALSDDIWPILGAKSKQLGAMSPGLNTIFCSTHKEEGSVGKSKDAKREINRNFSKKKMNMLFNFKRSMT
eukprot:superscaffoldBa00002594_g14749